MRRSLYSETLPIRALNASAISTNTNTEGTSINLEQFGSDFNYALFVLHAGTITDGTYTGVPQESANGSSGWTDVPADRLQGSVALTASHTLGAVGVIPQPNLKPHLRLRVTSTAVTTGGSVSAVALLSGGDTVPVRRA